MKCKVAKGEKRFNRHPSHRLIHLRGYSCQAARTGARQRQCALIRKRSGDADVFASYPLRTDLPYVTFPPGTTSSQHRLPGLPDCTGGLLLGIPCNQIGASGPCSFNNPSVVVHNTNPRVDVNLLACATRCIRLSWATSGAIQKSLGSVDHSLAHTREAIYCVYEANLIARSRTFMVPRSHSHCLTKI